jgi:hypothetical protein
LSKCDFDKNACLIILKLFDASKTLQQTMIIKEKALDFPDVAMRDAVLTE